MKIHPSPRSTPNERAESTPPGATDRPSGASRLTRRGFVALSSIATASLTAPAIAQARARIVVVGGGPAGATTARYLKRADPSLDVTLLGSADQYTTCFFSNMYLAGFWSLRALTFGYRSLADRYGVRFMRDIALGVDREQRRVILRNGDPLPYDRLVLAPGVSFRADAIEGYDLAAETAMPHSYHAGFQTYLLRRRLTEMRRGGVFVIAVPQGPYRAGTAPYERASMIAHLFTRINPRARIIIIDAKDDFGLRDRFLRLWSELYGDMIRWLPAAETGGGVVAVDAAEMTVTIGDGSRIQVDAACVIPPQRAADIVAASGLVDETGWAPVDAETLRSRIDPNVFVLGDSAAASPMPKSAFSANSHAHRCAAVIRAELGGLDLLPARYRAVAWAYVSPIAAIKSGASYRVADGAFERVAGFATPPEQRLDDLRGSALEGVSWYAGVTADIFS